jgi:hypothetical protein
MRNRWDERVEGRSTDNVQSIQEKLISFDVCVDGFDCTR